MKKNLIVLAMHNKYWLPALAIAGNILFLPLAAATVYNNSIDLNTDMLQNGDSVITSDTTGFYSTSSGGASLQLGQGAISVEMTTSTPNQSVQGANLSNGVNNDFGVGSSIVMNQTTTGSAGYQTNGVDLSGNATNMSASALTIKVDAQTIANGIKGSNNNTVTLGDGSKITVSTSAGRATGVRLDNGGSLSADKVEIHAKSQVGAYGIEVDNAAVNLGAGSKITAESLATTGTTSVAIALLGSSTLDASGITVVGNQAKGLSVEGTSRADLGQNSRVETTGNGYAGISMSGTDVNFEASGLTVKTSGDHAYGMNINNGGHSVDLGSGSTITTEGVYSTGVWQVGRDDSRFSADRLTIHVKGANANGLEVRRGSATVGAGSVITAEQGGAVVVNRFNGAMSSATINGSKLISGGSYAASAQGTSATVNLNDVEAVVDRNGGAAYAIWAVSGGVINANNLKVDGAAGVYGMVANGAGKITLQGTVNINAQSNVAMVSSDANSSITGNGLMTINGQIAAQNNSLINLTMTNGSVLNGAANQSSGGTLNLGLTGSRWRFDNDSIVNNLALAGNSSVEFATATDGQLTVTNLSGSGRFAMRTDIVNHSGDLLAVTGTTAGNHSVRVQNSGGSATDGTETLTIINTADGQGNFGLMNQVELGGYLYDLRKTGNDWELYSSGRASGSADASGNMLNAGYLMNYAETQTLLQRMGELRQSGSEGDVWVRAYYGNFDSFASGKLSGFDMSYQGLQLGADKIALTEGGRVYYGAFAGLADSDQHYAKGSGSLKSKSAGVYGSYVLNSGAYIDTVLKYQRHSNKLTVSDTQGVAVNGKGTSDGVVASIEAGQRFFFNETKSGVYVEPQLQLTYAWQDKAAVKNSNGLSVELNRYHSLLGRAGTLIGYEVNQRGKSPVSFYFKNSWLHEFDGDTGYTLNGAQEKLSFKGGAWVSGVGVSAKFADRHVTYLDMEKTTGKKFNQNQINVGYRYRF